VTGRGGNAFSHQLKSAKTHLPPVAIPDGVYPRILSDETYNKILERVKANSLWSPRNAKEPEAFLLRAGFARCRVCQCSLYGVITRVKGQSYQYYKCTKMHCSHSDRYVSAKVLDNEVWEAVVQLADFIPLMEQAIKLAIENHTVTDELKATEATLLTWKTKVKNFEDDLNDETLRGDTRAGIRNLLNTAYEMVEELETQRTELATFAIDTEKQRVEFEKILDWCKKVKSEREELTYTQKRDFLLILGVKVLVTFEKDQQEEPWDIKVSLPEVQEIIYHDSKIVGHSCLPTDMLNMPD
jgi:hypothetical protein